MTVALHHRVDGPPGAPVLLLSHSLGTSLELFEPQAALSRDFCVVRCDLRGHGRSPVPPGPYEIADLGADLVALLDRIGAARAHLGGVSLGGMASLWVAAHHPDRVDRLILCCTSARLGPGSLWRERAAAVRAGGTAAIADAVVARWFTPAYRARWPEHAAALHAALLATPAEGYAECCEAIERMDLRAELAAVRAPTLAIAGAQDSATPTEHLAGIIDGIAGARLAVVDGAHLASAEKSDEINALIEEHLGRAGGDQS